MTDRYPARPGHQASWHSKPWLQVHDFVVSGSARRSEMVQRHALWKTSHRQAMPHNTASFCTNDQST